MREINPTLFIGLGGTGHLFTSNLKDIITREYLGGKEAHFPLVQYLVIDTEFISIPYKDRHLSEEEKQRLKEFRTQFGGDFDYEKSITSCIDSHEQCEIQVNPGQMNDFLRNPRLLDAVDFMPESLEGIHPGTFGAGQIGLLGKLMGIAHFHDIYAKVDGLIQYLVGAELRRDLDAYWSDQFMKTQSQAVPLTVYISCSLSGGTGRGLCLMVASMVRYLMRKQRIEDHGKIILINFVPDCFETPGRTVPSNTIASLKANQYAAFKELDYILSNTSDGIQGALKMEHYFQQYVGEGTNHLSLVPFDGVYLISSRLERGSALKLDNYKMVNDIAARAVASLIFSNFQASLEAALCNKVLYPPMEEGKTMVERIRRYARIGRGALRYPVSRLIAYLKNYVCYYALLDLVDIQLEKKLPEHPPTTADREYKRIEGEVGQRFPTPLTLTTSQLGKDRSFEADWPSRIRDKFSSILSSMVSNHEEQEKRLLGDPGIPEASYLKEEMARLRGLLEQHIKDHGTDHTLEILRYLVNHITGSWNTVLADRRDLARNDAQSRKEFLDALDAKIQFLKDERAVAFMDGSHPGFEKIRTAVDQDKDNWRNRRGLFQKWSITKDDPKDVSSGTTKDIDTLITEFYQHVVRPLSSEMKERSRLRFLERFEEELVKLRDNLIKSAEVIRKKEEEKWGKRLSLDWKYYDEMKAIATAPKDPTDVYVHGRNQEEYKAFCDLFPQRKAILDQVQRELNEKVVPRFFDADITEDYVKSILEEVAFKEVDRHTGVGDVNICTFFRKLYAEEAYHEIERLWTALNRQAAWLGTTSPDRIGPKDRANAGFITSEFLEMACPEAFDKSQAAKSIFCQELNVIKRDLREEFILTRFQVAMPLFVHDAIYETATEYDQLARKPGTKGAATLAKFHTAQKFFYIDEPLGRVTHIPASELNETLNLMLHLGIIRVDDEGYLECLQSSEGTSLLEMKRWLTDREKVDRSSGILLEEFQSDPSKYSELMVHLLDRTTRRLCFLANLPGKEREKLGSEAQSIVIGYLKDENYPLIPETLLQNRLLKEKDIKKLFNQKHISDGYKAKKYTYAQKRRGKGDQPAYRVLENMLNEEKYEYPGLLRTVFEGLYACQGQEAVEEPKNVTGEPSTAPAEPADKGRESVQDKFKVIKEKLASLSQLLEDNLITQEDFEQQKKKALDEYMHA